MSKQTTEATTDPAGPRMLLALEAIAGMKVNEETDFRQLATLCITIARQTVAEVVR